MTCFLCRNSQNEIEKNLKNSRNNKTKNKTKNNIIQGGVMKSNMYKIMTLCVCVMAIGFSDNAEKAAYVEEVVEPLSLSIEVIPKQQNKNDEC